MPEEDERIDALNERLQYNALNERLKDAEDQLEFIASALRLLMRCEEENEARLERLENGK